MLLNSKFEAGETVSISLEGNNSKIKGENPKGGKKPDDPKDLLSNIIDKVNLMYQGQFSEADRVIVESIYDKMVTKAKKKLTKQANNTDEKQFEESIFPEIFDDIARSCYVEQMDSFGKLFENADFYKNVMTQMARAMYENFKQKETDMPFVPDFFKQQLLESIQDEFYDLRRRLPDLDSVVDAFIKVIQAKTISSVDGANDVLLDSFNRLYCLKDMKLVDKRRHSNTIITKYEAFLKKLYYMIHVEEMKSSKNPNSMPTFTDCIHSFECLRDLRTTPIARYQKFYTYLDDVKIWRNIESHEAHDMSVEEVDLAIRKATAMYLFVVAKNLEKL